jgi:hypothetical protein
VESRDRQYLNKDGGIRSKEGGIHSSWPSRQLMTSWGPLFNSLRRGFPNEDYHAGFRLVRFCAAIGRHAQAMLKIARRTRRRWVSLNPRRSTSPTYAGPPSACDLLLTKPEQGETTSNQDELSRQKTEDSD